MRFFLYFGIGLTIISLIFIIQPRWIIKLNKLGERVVFTDADFFGHPRISGILFIVLGLILIYVGYILKGVLWLQKYL